MNELMSIGYLPVRQCLVCLGLTEHKHQLLIRGRSGGHRGSASPLTCRPCVCASLAARASMPSTATCASALSACSSNLRGVGAR